MTLETIYQFFQEHHPNYLNEKLAVCYIASLLLKGDTYGTEIIQSLERNYPIYRLFRYGSLQRLKVFGNRTVDYRL